MPASIRREPLDDVQVRRRAAIAGVLREVRDVDDERVAFPVAARVAEIRADRRREVRPAVERDDARVVDHLVANRDVARALHDLRRVVVDRRENHMREPARDAAIVSIEILGPVERRAPSGSARPTAAAPRRAPRRSRTECARRAGRSTKDVRRDGFPRSIQCAGGPVPPAAGPPSAVCAARRTPRGPLPPAARPAPAAARIPRRSRVAGRRTEPAARTARPARRRS